MIHIPGPDTARRRLEARAQRGRPPRRLAGAWLADLAGLKKSVALCWACDAKWSPKTHGYRVWRRDYQVRDHCDGCRQNETCKLFVHESVVEQVGQLPRRRAGRWGTNVGWLPRWIRGGD